MKPRTKLERTVFELSQTLPPLTDKQEQWAYDNVFDRLGYKCKDEVWCLHCGNIFREDEMRDSSVCPSCGRKITIKKSRKQRDVQRVYFTVLDVSGGFQVCRHFIAQRTCVRGKETSFFNVEVVQNWISEKGKETILSRPCSSMSRYYDSWIYSEPMGIRHPYNNPYSNNYYRYVIDSYVYPGRKIIPLLKRNGYTSKAKYIAPNSLFIKLLTDNFAETMIKTGQYSLLAYYVRHGYIPCQYSHAIRIANRHGYKVKDASIWFDYIDLLEYFGKDTRNPKYLFPKKLRSEHDRLLKKRNEIIKLRRRKEEEERIRRMEIEAAAWKERYIKEKGRYFNIILSGDDMSVVVLRSVDEFEKEGNAMHHCVYTNGYYKKEDSLILSARSKEGERIETVELSLNTFRVIQSYGPCNNITEHHERIIQLVENNASRFLKAKNANAS